MLYPDDCDAAQLNALTYFDSTVEWFQQTAPGRSGGRGDLLMRRQVSSSSSGGGGSGGGGGGLSGTNLALSGSSSDPLSSSTTPGAGGGGGGGALNGVNGHDAPRREACVSFISGRLLSDIKPLKVRALLSV